MAGVCKKPLRSGKYRGWFTDLNGKQRFFTGVQSRAETRRIAERLEDEHREVRLGHRPPSALVQKHRAFDEAAADYVAWGRSRGGRGGRPWAERHARNREAQLKWWRERLGLETVADLEGTLPRVDKALQELQAAGKAGTTVQRYAETIRAFCRWCKSRGYLAHDPLEGLAGFDTTPRARRRAMTPEEINALLEASPPHRRLTYEVAFLSGLRASELRQLTPEHLDTRRGGLRLDADMTKNRRAGFQPLPAFLVKRLAAFAESGEAKRLYERAYKGASVDPARAPKNPLLYVPTHTARDMDIDLKAAGVPKWTPAGKVDFHAARVAYISLVFESGASLKEAQELARHQTAALTLNVYARARSERLAATVEAVAEKVEAAANHALSMHSLAAGAEGLDVSACDSRAYVVGGQVAAEGLEPSTRGL